MTELKRGRKMLETSSEESLPTKPKKARKLKRACKRKRVASLDAELAKKWPKPKKEDSSSASTQSACSLSHSENGDASESDHNIKTKCTKKRRKNETTKTRKARNSGNKEHSTLDSCSGNSLDSFCATSLRVIPDIMGENQSFVNWAFDLLAEGCSIINDCDEHIGTNGIDKDVNKEAALEGAKDSVQVLFTRRQH